MTKSISWPHIFVKNLASIYMDLMKVFCPAVMQFLVLFNRVFFTEFVVKYAFYICYFYGFYAGYCVPLEVYLLCVMLYAI